MARTPSSTQRAFAKALRQVRRSRGFTQEDFAEVSGRTYVSALERGLKSPTFHKIAALADVLDVHPLSLLTLAYLHARRGETVDTLWSRIRRELASFDQDAA